MLRIHDLQRLDVIQAQRPDPLARLVEHGFGDVDAGDAGGLRVVGQGQAGANADLQDVAADAFGGDDGGAASLAEHGTEDDVVYRRPAVVRRGDSVPVHGCHTCQNFCSRSERRTAAP